MLLGCIADDFTGATDLANNLVRAGMRVVQTIGVPEQPLGVGSPDRGVTGEPASHGCVRMTSDDVAELFERVPVGTRVFIEA